MDPWGSMITKSSFYSLCENEGTNSNLNMDIKVDIVYDYFDSSILKHPYMTFEISYGLHLLYQFYTEECPKRRLKITCKFGLLDQPPFTS